MLQVAAWRSAQRVYNVVTKKAEYGIRGKAMIAPLLPFAGIQGGSVQGPSTREHPLRFMGTQNNLPA